MLRTAAGVWLGALLATASLLLLVVSAQRAVRWLSTARGTFHPAQGPAGAPPGRVPPVERERSAV